MTPRLGASGADWSTALAPGLDGPGVNPVPRTGASKAMGPPGLEHPGSSGKRTNAWNPDPNIRRGNATGLEHPEALDWSVRGYRRGRMWRQRDTARRI